VAKSCSFGLCVEALESRSLLNAAMAPPSLLAHGGGQPFSDLHDTSRMRVLSDPLTNQAAPTQTPWTGNGHFTAWDSEVPSFAESRHQAGSPWMNLPVASDTGPALVQPTAVDTSPRSAADGVGVTSPPMDQAPTPIVSATSQIIPPLVEQPPTVLVPVAIQSYSPPIEQVSTLNVPAVANQVVTQNATASQGLSVAVELPIVFELIASDPIAIINVDADHISLAPLQKVPESSHPLGLNQPAVTEEFVQALPPTMVYGPVVSQPTFSIDSPASVTDVNLELPPALQRGLATFQSGTLSERLTQSAGGQVSNPIVPPIDTPVATAVAQQSNALQSRDQNSVSSAATRVPDLFAPQGLASQASVVTLTSASQDSQGRLTSPQFVIQQGSDNRASDRAVAGAAGSRAVVVDSEIQQVTVFPLPSSAHPVPALAAPPYTMLVANIFPHEASNLGSSIKDFFERVDQLGHKLSDEHYDLLYSVGITTAAAVVALELARRRVRRKTHLLTPRLGTIPYSDFP
jgi:hypothetical protein